MGKQKSSVGCLFWIALILLVLVIFLLNRNTIETVLDKTGLVDHIARERDGTQDIEVEQQTIDTKEEQPESPPMDTIETVIIEPESLEVKTRIVVEEETEPKEDIGNVEQAKSLRRSTLYYVFIDANSEISLRTVSRPVYFDNSPLTDTLLALLQGLSASEINKGLLSLLPVGTQIRGVAVRGNTAYIDFSEAFRFNAFGQEGYRYQLQQIVYTATEFQTVRDVQILIEGERQSYLGPESPFIGEPLSRESLS